MHSPKPRSPKSAPAHPSYAVRYFKRLCNDRGREMRVLQRTVLVPARSRSDALDRARAEMADKHRTPGSVVDAMEVEVSPA